MYKTCKTVRWTAACNTTRRYVAFERQSHIHSNSRLYVFISQAVRVTRLPSNRRDRDTLLPRDPHPCGAIMMGVVPLGGATQGTPTDMTAVNLGAVPLGGATTPGRTVRSPLYHHVCRANLGHHAQKFTAPNKKGGSVKARPPQKAWWSSGGALVLRTPTSPV